jgi:DNA polymerase III alpha subunit
MAQGHYPAEFMAAVLSTGGVLLHIRVCLRGKGMGITFLPPDINLSEIKYTGRIDT